MFREIILIVICVGIVDRSSQVHPYYGTTSTYVRVHIDHNGGTQMASVPTHQHSGVVDEIYLNGIIYMRLLTTKVIYGIN